MADLKISALARLAAGSVATDDELAVVDSSASETKRILLSDLLGSTSMTLITDASIPNAKIVWTSGTLAGSALANQGVGTTQIANDAITSVQLADESTVDLVTSLPSSGGYVGQLAVDTDSSHTCYVWDGSAWQAISAGTTSVAGSTTGIVNIVATTSGSSVTISATLDDSSNAKEFLAGPTGAGGTVGYRQIAATDLPTATGTAQGAIKVNGEGLRLDNGVIEVDSDVTAATSHAVVTHSTKGIITGSRSIISSDLPDATSSAKGAVKPGTGLSVTSGTVNHSNSIVAGTGTKLTVDAQGHVTNIANLADSDVPNIPATKLTSGTLSADRLATNSIPGNKLGDASTTLFGGPGSTSLVVTFPTAEFKGQRFWDSYNEDEYIWDGNSWIAVTITAGELIYGGLYSASDNTVSSITTAGGAAGLTAGNPLPAASTTNQRVYLVCDDTGTGSGNAPAVTLNAPDYILSSGTQWNHVDVSSAIAATSAANVSFTPYGQIAATTTQGAIQELEDEKASKAGATFTGPVLIDGSGSNTGTLKFEGSSPDDYETEITIQNPTADRQIQLPNASGTVLLAGAGSVVDADISSTAEIAVSKLADGDARQILQTDTAGTGVEWTSNVDIPGTLDVTGAGTFDSTGTFGSHLTINAGSDLRLADSDSSHYVGFKPPATVASNVVWTLPDADSSGSQVLQSNGSGVLSWVSLSSFNDASLTGTTSINQTTIDEYLRFNDSDDSHYVGLVAPAAIGTSFTLTLPVADGSNAQVLQTNGSGALSWADNTGATVVDGGNFVNGTSIVTTSSTIDAGSFN